MSTVFERIVPVFPVRDVRRALEHYRKLGFCGEAYDEGETEDPIYGYLERGNVRAHLARVDDLDPRINMSACYVYVDDAEALHREWQAASAGGRLHPPVDTPYGLREFAHVDEDGNLWRVGSPVVESA